MSDFVGQVWGRIVFDVVSTQTRDIIAGFLSDKIVLDANVTAKKQHKASFCVPRPTVTVVDITWEPKRMFVLDVKESLLVITEFLEGIGVTGINVDVVVTDESDWSNIVHYTWLDGNIVSTQATIVFPHQKNMVGTATAPTVGRSTCIETLAW